MILLTLKKSNKMQISFLNEQMKEIWNLKRHAYRTVFFFFCLHLGTTMKVIWIINEWNSAVMQMCLYVHMYIVRTYIHTYICLLIITFVIQTGTFFFVASHCLPGVIITTQLFYFQVPITVYYESLCPDSAKFITEQLYPAVKGDLKDHVEITWVPFGKSKVSWWCN